MAGRPPKDNSRDKQYRVRLNDEDWDTGHISLKRIIDCPYCKAKNRCDFEDECDVCEDEDRPMGNFYGSKKSKLAQTRARTVYDFGLKMA